MLTLLSIHTFACDVLVLLGTESTESLEWLISFKQYMNIKWLSQCVKSLGSQCKPFNGFITIYFHVSCSLSLVRAESAIEFCDAMINWSIHNWVSSTQRMSSEHLSLFDLFPMRHSVTSVVNWPERLNAMPIQFTGRINQSRSAVTEHETEWNTMQNYQRPDQWNLINLEPLLDTIGQR